MVRADGAFLVHVFTLLDALATDLSSVPFVKATNRGSHFAQGGLIANAGISSVGDISHPWILRATCSFFMAVKIRCSSVPALGGNAHKLFLCQAYFDIKEEKFKSR